MVQHAGDRLDHHCLRLAFQRIHYLCAKTWLSYLQPKSASRLRMSSPRRLQDTPPVQIAGSRQLSSRPMQRRTSQFQPRCATVKCISGHMSRILNSVNHSRRLGGGLLATYLLTGKAAPGSLPSFERLRRSWNGPPQKTVTRRVCYLRSLRPRGLLESFTNAHTLRCGIAIILKRMGCNKAGSEGRQP